MRLSENGALSSVRLTLTVYGTGLLELATDGILTKCSSNQRSFPLPCRAVDQDGDVLDIMVQSRRDKKAAQKFFRKL